MSKKVVIITGGTRGIGLGIAKGFLKEVYRAILNYRSDDQTAQAAASTLGAGAACVRADITVKEDRERLLQETEALFGRMDVLVNNAGIIRLGQSL